MSSPRRDGPEADATPLLGGVPPPKVADADAGADLKAPSGVRELALVASMAGLLFGLDTGVISGALPYLRLDLLASVAPHRLAAVEAAIVSATALGAGVGSLAGGAVADAAGRRAALLAADALFLGGALAMAAAGGARALIVGRALVGLGVGLASVAAPVYIAEAAPPRARAALVTHNVLAITAGQLLAYLLNLAFSFLPGSWRWMLGAAALPAAAQAALLLSLPESPRWLAGRGRGGAAARAAARLGLPEREFRDAAAAAAVARLSPRSRRNGGGAAAGDGGWRALAAPPARRALRVGVGLQILQQVAGINTVMYLSATVLQAAGFASPRVALGAAIAPAAVNAAGTVVGLHLIDRAGRRPLLLWSVAGATLALAALAANFTALDAASPPAAPAATSTCAVYTSASGEALTVPPTCAACLRAGCLFCGAAAAPLAPGACLRAEPGAAAACAALAPAAAAAPAAARALSAEGCPAAPTRAWGSLLLLCLYVAAFAPGLGPVPWAINAEIFPEHIRGRAAGIAAAANWAANAAVSAAFLPLTRAAGAGAAFAVLALLAAAGGAWAYVALPETKGLTLEAAARLFGFEGGEGGGEAVADEELQPVSLRAL
jgi:SP family myo-inositol transporter-like MFS transporter 13